MGVGRSKLGEVCPAPLPQGLVFPSNHSELSSKTSVYHSLLVCRSRADLHLTPKRRFLGSKPLCDLCFRYDRAEHILFMRLCSLDAFVGRTSKSRGTASAHCWSRGRLALGISKAWKTNDKQTETLGTTCGKPTFGQLPGASWDWHPSV